MSSTLEPTRWQRINYTPLRDLIRGRVTARLDLRGNMLRSGLPAEAQALIERTVSRTRLWLLEKADVQNELTAHFRDGLDAGMTTEDLVAGFGDARRAAKLIRRAKIRNRSFAWHVLNGSLKAIGVFLLLYALATAVLMLREPDVSVDYVAVMNRDALAVPESDRAWPVYRRLLGEHSRPDWWKDQRRSRLDIEPLYVDQDPTQPLARPGRADWSRAAASLRARRDLLDAIRRAAAKPGLGLPVGFADDFSFEDRAVFYGPEAAEPAPPSEPTDAEWLARESLGGVLLPHLQPMREMGILLAADLQLAADEGDIERVLANVDAVAGLARHVRENPTVIADLVARYAIDGVLLELGYAFHRRPQAFDDAALVELAHRVAALPEDGTPHLSGERLWMLDTLQRLYGRDGRITYDGLQMLPSLMTEPAELRDVPLHIVGLPAAAVLLASRDEMLAQYDRILALSEAYAAKPLWEQLRTSSGVADLIETWKGSSLTLLRYWPLVQLAPALEGAAERARTVAAMRDAILVVIALEAYRCDYGSYPDSLAALSPRYLPAPPVDHSTGQPLLMRVVDGEPVLYGRGMDGDDDGGTMPDDATYRWPQVPETGDWVVFPPYVEPAQKVEEPSGGSFDYGAGSKPYYYEHSPLAGPNNAGAPSP